MSRRFEGKTAIVTGGSRGMGQAIVERLAADGAAVVANDVANDELAARVVHELTGRGARAVAVKADVSQASHVQRLFDEAEQAFGPIDIVVANAAVVVIKPLIDSTEQDYQHVFGTNVKGVFFTLQEAARRLRNDGSIIVISTGGTKMQFDKLSLYLGSKGAVEQFVRVLAREVGARGITVDAVSPGFTDTEMLPDRDRAVAAGLSPFNRVGSTSDVADAVALLASADARWVTGQNIAAGGGVF